MVIDGVDVTAVDKVARYLCTAAANLVHVGGGMYTFTDAARGKVVTVDTVNGLVYGVSGRLLINGVASRKNNGYVYVSLTIINDGGDLETVMIGQHDLILLVVDPAAYKDGDICMHLNNCPWINGISNIKWGSIEENNRHSNAVRKLYERHDARVVPVKNAGGFESLQLLEPLTTEEIKDLNGIVDDPDDWIICI